MSPPLFLGPRSFSWSFSAGLGWFGLVWAGLGWVGLGWAGLGWFGVVWAGLGWFVLDRGDLVELILQFLEGEC